MSRLVPVPTSAIVETSSPADVARIVAQFEGLPALKFAEPALDHKVPRSESAEVRKWLKAIGMKAWPLQADAAKTEWLNAMLLALSDLPGAVAIAALKDAVHHPFRFHNEVEPWVRDRAALIRKHVNLLPWHAQRRARPVEQPMLEAPGTRWTQAEVDDANASFKAIGIARRFKLVGDQVETFECENT